MSLYNEQDILENLKQNDVSIRHKAFEQVVHHYSQKVYWQVRKMVLSHDDANDLVQNTFIKAWLNIAHFRGDAKLSTWIYKIAINESITFLNKQRAQMNISMDDEDIYLSEKLESDVYFDGDAAQKKLQQAIASLPDKQRAVFNLRYYDEMPYEEMSEVLGTSVGALKASYHHAAKKVEDFLKQD
jgi:RNA polymerase sigma factor, sigma-70 family